MRERLIELISRLEQEYMAYREDCLETDLLMVSFEEMLADHLLAEGVIVPPVKVGQGGYWLISNGIRFVTFDKILTVGTEWRVRARYFVTETVYFSFDKFGKTVFLTREEAEKALAGREGKG